MFKLNQNQIKFLTIIFMTMNHIGQLLIPEASIYHNLFINIGQVTMYVMGWFFVDGFHYTRSKSKYVIRLLIFAVLAQIPFMLTVADGFQLNVLFTFIICFGILYVANKDFDLIYKILLIFLLTLCSLVCDCGLILPLIVLCFELSRSSKLYRVMSCLLVCGLFFLFSSAEYSDPESSIYWTNDVIISSIYAIVPWIIMSLVLLFFNTGTRSEKFKNFNKWFFYIYYPAHLILLFIICKIV